MNFSEQHAQWFLYKIFSSAACSFSVWRLRINHIMDLFSRSNLVTYLSNNQNEWQNEQQVEQENKRWSNMSKVPGLGGPHGGLCNILCPKKYDKKKMYQSFLPQSGISNKSIIHIVFIIMCINVAKEPVFIYCWNIYFCYIFAHIFLNQVLHLTQDTC